MNHTEGKRITICCGAGIVSGKEIMSLELGAGLKQAGHEVRYIMSSWGSQQFADSAGSQGIPCEKMRMGFISATLTWDCIRMTLNQLWRIPWLWLTFFWHLQSKRPEVIIHTNWHHLLVLWPFHKLTRDLYWMHEVVPDQPQYQWLHRQLSSRLGKLIAVSDAVRASVLALGVSPEIVQTIHNGLQDPASDATGAVRPQSEAIRIGIVGQVEPWKGHHLLLEAMAEVTKDYPSAEVHVYGDGSTTYREELLALADRAGLQQRLVFCGRQNNKSDIYSALDMCVVPVPANENEALPTVAIEAAFFALPVVASKRGGLPEIIAHGETGLLVEAGNISQLASAIASLCADSQVRFTMGASARRRAKTLFSLPRFVAAFDQAIDLSHVA